MLVSNVLTITKPNKMIMEYCRKNLTVRNPVYERNVRMGFWNGNTPRELAFYTKLPNGSIQIPFGCLREVYPLLQEQITTDFAKKEFVEYGGERVSLWEYQETALKELLKANFGILQSKAGSGKTRIGIALAQRVSERCLWITHTIDLLNQAKDTALQFGIKGIGTITGGKVNIGDTITFATVQTLANVDLELYSRYWDVVIVDECHRVAGTPTSATQFSKVLNKLKARHKFGLSATVHRADGLIKATFSLLGNIVYTVPDSAVESTIMRVGVQAVETGVKISEECLDTDGTIIHAKLLTYLADNYERNKLIASLVEDKPTLILTDRVFHADNIYNLLPDDLKDKTVIIDGKTNKIKRENALTQMRVGEKQILIATFSLAKEGLDIPRLERLILASPQKDYAVITQAIGRIARTCEGKDNPVCLDLVDDIAYCVKAWKKRRTTYNKNQCYYL